MVPSRALLCPKTIELLIPPPSNHISQRAGLWGSTQNWTSCSTDVTYGDGWVIFSKQKTCSCPLVQYFWTLFLDEITYFRMKIKYNNPLIGSKLCSCLSLKNHNYSLSQNVVILSQNNVRKNCTKGHKQ